MERKDFTDIYDLFVEIKSEIELLRDEVKSVSKTTESFDSNIKLIENDLSVLRSEIESQQIMSPCYEEMC